jgi:hypothetical protein
VFEESKESQRRVKGRSPMSDPDVWREKAAMLRDRADETDDVDRRRVLRTLAEDCDQMAADVEKGVTAG